MMLKSHRTIGRSVAASALVAVAGASVALGQTADWTSAGGGVFGDASNWNTPDAPGMDDDIRFLLDATYTITFAQDRTTNAALFDAGDVTLDLGGFTHTATAAFPEYVSIGATAAASVTVLNGAVDWSRIMFGEGFVTNPNPAGGGTLIFGAGATFNGGDIRFGAGGPDPGRGGGVQAGVGRLVFRDGAQGTFTNMDSVGFGTTRNQRIEITGAGTSVSGGAIRVGAYGSGELSVTDGATLTMDTTLSLGLEDNARSEVVFDNATGALQTIETNVGAGGAGDITVRNTAQVTLSILRLGFGMGETNLSVEDAGTYFQTSSVNVGTGGFAAVNVSGGAEFRGLNTQIGQFGDGHGEINFTGADTTGALGSATFGQVIGQGAYGKVTVMDDADLLFASSPDVGQSADASGLIEVGDGGTWRQGGATESNKTYVFGAQGTGELRLHSGGTMIMDDRNMVFGEAAGSTGMATIDGAGTLLELGLETGDFFNGDVTVGLAGMGQVSVTGGAFVRSETITIGADAGSDGEVNLDGTGTNWTVRYGDVLVGVNGVGRLTVENGAELEVDNGALIVGALGKVSGDGGTIKAGVTNSGAVELMGDADPLSIEGDYMQDPGARLDIVIGGATPRGGSTNPLLLALGDLLLDGDLSVMLADGSTPTPGSSWILAQGATRTGEFASATLPTTGQWSVVYGDNNVTLMYVPAPTSGALLALAGVMASRRRRSPLQQ